MSTLKFLAGSRETNCSAFCRRATRSGLCGWDPRPYTTAGPGSESEPWPRGWFSERETVEVSLSEAAKKPPSRAVEARNNNSLAMLCAIHLEALDELVSSFFVCWVKPLEETTQDCMFQLLKFIVLPLSAVSPLFLFVVSTMPLSPRKIYCEIYCASHVGLAGLNSVKKLLSDPRASELFYCFGD
jgi:hypothetical protein